MTEETEPVAESAYDQLADSYAEAVRTSPYNANLEFPATSDLVPEVAGKRVLDAGCGTGFYCEWLQERGADVVGVDTSEEMLEQARERVSADVELHQGDLAEPLSFAETNGFDGVLSALALSYIEDWRQPFSEFTRILRPGGFLVFSTGHPLDQFPSGDDEQGANYFEVEPRTKQWAVEVPYYRRPLSEVVNPLLETGFRLDTLVEPQPTAEFRERWPERYETESRQPVFLCVRARLS